LLEDFLLFGGLLFGRQFDKAIHEGIPLAEVAARSLANQPVER
jgi:hypothetical protein